MAVRNVAINVIFSSEVLSSELGSELNASLELAANTSPYQGAYQGLICQAVHSFAQVLVSGQRARRRSMKVIIKGLKLVKGPVEFYPSMPQKWYVVESGEKLDAVLENGQRFTLQQVPLKHKPRMEGEARYEGGQAILSSGVYQGPEFRVQGYFMDSALVLMGDNVLLDEEGVL